MKKRLNVLFASILLFASVMLYFPASAGPCNAWPDGDIRNDALMATVGDDCICYSWGLQCVFDIEEVE